MAEETKEVATPPTPNNTEVEQLKESVKKLEAKNYELIVKLQNQKKEKEVPEDYQSLLAFKQKVEKEKLESEGKYTEATQALEQQYRDKSAEDKKRIEELTARNRELELIAPAMQALSEITHDPELVLNNLIPKDKMQIKEGIPVVVDGYEQLPVQEYVKNKLEKEKPYLLKNKQPTGGGAPISRPSSENFSEDMLKPFLKASEDITEQGRIFKTYGKETWQKLRDIAKTR
jgi:predicted RNase H-like nuclease (RuvC/YqgF family)